MFKVESQIVWFGYVIIILLIFSWKKERSGFKERINSTFRQFSELFSDEHFALEESVNVELQISF